MLCIRARVEQRKSYSCSTDCLRQHWSEHKSLHQNGVTRRHFSTDAEESIERAIRKERDIDLHVQGPTSMATRLRMGLGTLVTSRTPTPSAMAERRGLRWACEGLLKHPVAPSLLAESAVS